MNYHWCTLGPAPESACSGGSRIPRNSGTLFFLSLTGAIIMWLIVLGYSRLTRKLAQNTFPVKGHN